MLAFFLPLQVVVSGNELHFLLEIFLLTLLKTTIVILWQPKLVVLYNGYQEKTLSCKEITTIQIASGFLITSDFGSQNFSVQKDGHTGLVEQITKIPGKSRHHHKLPIVLNFSVFWLFYLLNKHNDKVIGLLQ